MSEHLKRAHQYMMDAYNEPDRQSMLGMTRKAIWKILAHLEEEQAKSSQAQPASTEPATTDGLSAAATSAEPSTSHVHLGVSAMATIEVPTSVLLRLAGCLTEEESSHVGQCSMCLALLGRSLWSQAMLAQRVVGPVVESWTSTSVKVVSTPSAEVSASEDATSPSSASSDFIENLVPASNGDPGCMHRLALAERGWGCIWCDFILPESSNATTGERVCKFFGNLPCPLHNVYCRAPDCMIPAPLTQTEEG